MRSVVRLTLATVFAVAVAGAVSAAEPAPSPKDVKEAVDTLHDVYESDYKSAEKDPKEKKALAKKLFDGAPKRKTAAMQFASYDEARRLAAAAGDAKLALEALSALTAQFTVSADLTADTLKALGDADLTPADAIALITLASNSANAALEREDYTGAVALSKLIAAAAKKTEDPDRLIEARKFLTKVEGLKKAVDTIKQNPNDPTANESLGQYWTFTRGRWDVGLKYLAKGSNKELAAAAGLDVDQPKTAKGRTAVADAWYKLAEDYKGNEKQQIVGRAWEWYSGALAVANGDEDLKPTVRIKEIEKKYPDLFDQTLEGHTGAAAGVMVTPDGKTLVSVGNDTTVRLWDAATGKFIKTLAGHTRLGRQRRHHCG